MLSLSQYPMEDGVLGAVPEMLTRAKPSLDLGITRVRIALNVGPHVVEK